MADYLFDETGLGDPSEKTLGGDASLNTYLQIWDRENQRFFPFEGKVKVQLDEVSNTLILTIQNDDITEMNVETQEINDNIQEMNTNYTERLTNGVRSILTDHAYIHQGIAYRAVIYLASLPSTVEYVFKTPAAKAPHFKNIDLTALGGSVKLSILKDETAAPLVIDSYGTAPAAGELVGPNNLKHKAAASQVTITKTPTYVSNQNGTVWDSILLVGDSTNQYISTARTSSFEAEELLMDFDEDYIIRLEKVGNDTPTNVTLRLFWYEEDGR